MENSTIELMDIFGVEDEQNLEILEPFLSTLFSILPNNIIEAKNEQHSEIESSTPTTSSTFIEIFEIEDL